MSAKLWGGRFSGQVDPDMERFNRSLPFCRRLWRQDLIGSKAYAKGLHKAGLLTEEETNSLVAGLQTVLEEWENGTFVELPSDEDIHTANERRLVELVGEVGKKLHTGRSRNDQVATDLRMWTREHIDELGNLLASLISVCVRRADKEKALLMPGYTHLQRAQPIRFSHWLLAHCTALRRDAQRLQEIRARVNVLPLGSGALAGNAFKIDRHYLAEQLEFDEISVNSLDGTADRDFVTETLQWAATVALHLSKMAEDLIIYSTSEFGFVTLADAYSTGSSLMPQKKNADSLELIRGKAGRLFGNMAGFMMTVKGLPSTYNKDLQEDKEALFDTVDQAAALLRIMGGVVATMQLNSDKMFSALDDSMLATDLAFYLVNKGMPFRTAHHRSGECVQLAEELDCGLSELTLSQLQNIDALFADDVVDVFQFDKAVDTYDAEGGTSLRCVQVQLDAMYEWLNSDACPFASTMFDA